MSTSALTLMILVQGSVIVISTYFLLKVLKKPGKPDNSNEIDDFDNKVV